MSTSSVSINKLKVLFRERLNVDVMDPDTDLLEEGLLDSLLLVELLFLLETEYGITLPIEELDLERLRSISSVVELIKEVSDS